MSLSNNRRLELYDISKFLLVLLTGIIIITSLLFIVGISVSPINFIFALIAAIGYTYVTTNSVRTTLLITGISLIIFILCVMMSSVVFDRTWDGCAYHKQAVGLLKEGWNPIYQSSYDFNNITKSVLHPTDGPLLWAEVYPKATWYFASVIYSITGNIESGKAYTLLFMVVTFGLYFDYLKSKFKKSWKAVLIAAVAALNPIALSQFQSYYLDGAVSCALLSLMVVFVAFFDKDYKRNQFDLYCVAFCLIVFSCNTKFSVILYTGTVCIIFFIYSLWRKPGSIVDYIKRFGFFVSSAIFSLLIVGFSPLITNVMRYKNMFYGFSDMVTPDNMAFTFGISGLSNAKMFVYSIFGRMSHGEYHTLGQLLKIPFTFSDSELAYYHYVDTRVGGFGVFFSGIFLLSVAVILVAIIKTIKKRNDSFWISVIMLAVCGLEMLVLPTTFTARYIPQLYFVIIFAATICLLYTENTKGKRKVIASVYALILCVFVFLNIGPYGPVIVDKINADRDTAATLQYLGELSDHKYLTVAIYSPDFIGIEYNLKDYGIDRYSMIGYEKIDATFDSTYSYWVYYKIK